MPTSPCDGDAKYIVPTVCDTVLSYARCRRSLPRAGPSGPGVRGDMSLTADRTFLLYDLPDLTCHAQVPQLPSQIAVQTFCPSRRGGGKTGAQTPLASQWIDRRIRRCTTYIHAQRARHELRDTFTPTHCKTPPRATHVRNQG
jgi:hypothetical protein